MKLYEVVQEHRAQLDALAELDLDALCQRYDLYDDA